MPLKILVPSKWEQLSSKEKELALEWIKSILNSVEYSKNLLKLLNSNYASAEFTETSKETSIQQEDFEIIMSTSNAEMMLTENVINISRISCSVVCTYSPNSEECKECLRNQ